MTHTVTTHAPTPTRAPAPPPGNEGASHPASSGRKDPARWLRAESLAAYAAIIVIWIVLEIAHAWRRLRVRMD